MAFKLQGRGTPSAKKLCGPDSVTTGIATYQPNYNYLGSVKNITYENTVTYTNGRSEGRSFQTDQQLVQDTTIHLYPLVGESDQGGSSVASVTVEGDETGFKSVSGPFSLVVPTRLSVTEWEQLLSEQTHVNGVDPHGDQAVKINFDDSDYNLKCSPVGVGEKPDNDPTYVENNDGNQDGGGTAYNISWVDTGLVPGPTDPSEACSQFPCNVTLQASTDPTQIGAPVGFGSGDGKVATVQERLNVTGRAGASQTNVRFNRAVGNATLWTQSGGAKDPLVVSTPSSADFESGLGEYSNFGSFRGNDPDKRYNSPLPEESNSGEWAALLDGGNDGGIKTTGYDTTGGESVIIQYWVRNNDEGDTDDDNGRLVVEYLSKDGSWVEADSKPQDDRGAAEEIRTVRLGEEAIHDNFGLRFKQEGADNANDEWLIDDPTITVLGTTVAPGAVNGGNGGGGGNGGSGPSGFSDISATEVSAQSRFTYDGSQIFRFTLNKSLSNGETVTINFDGAQGLSGGQNGFPDPADYRFADIDNLDSSLSGGTATITATAEAASVTYQANQGISSGTTIKIAVDTIGTEGQSADTVSVSFDRSDGTTELMEFSVD
jgi:hypothetical protein